MCEVDPPPEVFSEAIRFVCLGEVDRRLPIVQLQLLDVITKKIGVGIQ